MVDADTDEEEPEDPELTAQDAAMVRRLREDPRMREFKSLGWAVMLFPLDLIEDRFVARMFVRTWYGFETEDVCELRARQLAVDDEPARTWWVIAIRQSAIDTRRRQKRERQPDIQPPS